MAVFGLACGSPVDQPGNFSGDSYNGVIDGSVLDGKFQPSTDRVFCQNVTPCYAAQVGYAKGNQVLFYNAGSVQTSLLPVTLGPSLAARASDASGGFRLDTFRSSTCTPRPAADPLLEAFPTDRQSPVVDALPTAPVPSSKAITFPFATVFDVTGVSGQCNDIKTRDSIGDSVNGPGRNGALRSASPVDYEVTLLMDPAAAFFDREGRQTAMPTAWFRGLQVGYLGGGGNKIPQDANGNFLFMEGAIANPSTKFAAPTDAKVIVLPFAPGDAPATATTPGYSPLVHLHNFALPAGKKPGDYRGICQTGDLSCAGNSSYIKATDLAAAFNTLFIVASPQ
jgi:hypothetical protein